MVHSESAIASIGIKIKIADLIKQINTANYKLIAEMLVEGSIDDENQYFNEGYAEIVNEIRNDEAAALETKERQQELIDKLQNTWSYYMNRFTNERIPNNDDGSMYEQHILIPTWTILETTRWGWGRDGTNAKSMEIDSNTFDLTTHIKTINKKYKGIKNWSLVFMLSQYSG